MNSLDDWQARWYDWLERRSQKVTLGYSIRRCGEDEIEIRASLLDGVVRGYIRAVLLGMLMLYGVMSSHPGSPAFADEIKSIKRDFEWAFNPDKELKPMYEHYEEVRIRALENDEFIKLEKKTYEEYKAPYLEGHFWSKLKIFAYGLVFLILLYLFFWPRARGLRVNRKERVIYWQTLGRGHSVTFVPETGDPLSGLYYNKFGLYVRAWGNHHSLEIYIDNLESGLTSNNWIGIYPTPSVEHNNDLINAMRDFLSEDNPEFLSRIGKRFKLPWTHPLMMLCNSFVYSRHFYRKRADIAIARAKALFAQKSKVEQDKWFWEQQQTQLQVNRNTREDGLDNRVPWDDPRKR